MLNAMVYVPYVHHHSSVPSCACYYEHRYGIECLCECHSFSAQLESFIASLIIMVLILGVSFIGFKLLNKIIYDF